MKGRLPVFSFLVFSLVLGAEAVESAPSGLPMGTTDLVPKQSVRMPGLEAAFEEAARKAVQPIEYGGEVSIQITQPRAAAELDELKRTNDTLQARLLVLEAKVKDLEARESCKCQATKE